MTVLAQLKRELCAFFYSPIAYVVITAATIVNSVIFLIIIDFLSDPRSGRGAPMQMIFGGTVFFFILLVVIAPLITMRLLAEERHTGTMETLLTAPIDETRVVLAKYLAAVCFYVTLWLPTLAYPLVLSRYTDLDLGPIGSGYLGTLGIGMMFLAIDLLFSALSKNQIVAALLSFAANMFLFVLGIFAFVRTGVSPDSVLNYVNLWNHMEDFGRGIVDTRYLVYYGSVILFMLFCTVQVLQARRWRG